MRRAKLALAAGALLLPTLSGVVAAATRTLTAARAAQSPTLDGRLDDPCWQGAPKAAGFSVIYEAGTAAAPQSVGRVVHDDANLYVGVECAEPEMDVLRRAVGRGEGAFDYNEGETVEIFLDVNHDRETFFQIMVNTNGSWTTHATEAMHLSNVVVTPAVHLAGDGFSMEVQVPFAVLHLQPNPDGTWGFNLCRARMILGQPGHEVPPNEVYSAWQNTGGAFRRPDRFGVLTIDADLSRYWYGVDVEDGAGEVTVRIANRTGAERSLTCETVLGGENGRRHGQALRLAADQTTEMSLPKQPGRLDIGVTLRETDTGRVVYRGGTVLAEADGPAADSGTLDAGASDYLVFSRNYLERGSHRSVPRAEAIDRPVTLFASPGEAEPATFAVRAGKDLNALSVELAGPLRGDDGKSLPEDYVEIRVVESMKRWLSPTEYRRTECFLLRNRPRDIPAGTTQRYWLTVYLAANAAPGRYRTAIRIAPENAPPRELPLTIEVLPIPLCAPEGMNYFMYFRPSFLPGALRTEEYCRLIWEDMRDHGMTSFTLYGYPAGKDAAGKVWVSVDRDRVEPLSMGAQIELARETGLAAAWSALPWIGAECYGLGTWQHVFDQASKRGWPELLWYLVDEPTTGRYERVEASFRKIADFRKRNPEAELRTTTAGASNPKVCHHYDVWIAGAGVEEETLAKARSMGKELWTYDCGLAPVDALTDRHYFGLWSWKTGQTGASHWAYYDASAMSRFNVAATWTGTERDLTENTHRFNFVYPMPGELVPTIGWEAIREGVDDYRYLLTLKKTIEVARTKGIAPALVEDADTVLRQVAGVVTVAGFGRARRTAKESDVRLARDFDRAPPEPGLTLDDYDRLRRRAAEQVLRLRRELGADAPVFAATARPSPRRPSPPARRPAGGPALELRPQESVWDSCEDLTVMNTTYAQRTWDPKAFKGSRIGEVSVSRDEKVEGQGSIHWVVTKADVDEALKQNPKFWIAALHKLYGRDWSPYAELAFHIRCDSPKHPPVYCQLLATKYPLIRVLDRNETTDGWKEVRWDLRKADIGVSEKYGALMNYVRFYAAAKQFEDGDALDIYLDNMRLTTGAAPEEE